MVFAALDKIVEDPGAILATNTSAIPVMRLGMATRRADHVVGLHFFNPVPVLPLVEVVTSLHTSPDVASLAAEFVATALDKTVVRSHDRAGFVVNALRFPYLLSAIRTAESGFATTADTDAGMELGCAHPMGPLSLTDLIGLDTVASIATSLYVPLRRVQGTSVRPATAAPAHGRGGPAQPKGGARVPHVRPGLRGPGPSRTEGPAVLWRWSGERARLRRSPLRVARRRRRHRHVPNRGRGCADALRPRRV